MNRAQYQKVKEVFNQAVELSLDERAAFIAEQCADDTALRRAVEDLLANDQSQFLEHPVIENFVDSAAPNESVVMQRIEKQKTTVEIRETTKLFEPDEGNSKLTNQILIEEPTEVGQVAADERTPRPSYWRLALIGLLFVFLVGWHAINFVAVFSSSSLPEFVSKADKDKHFMIRAVALEASDRLQPGDEIVSVNNEPINTSNSHILFGRIKAGEQYTLGIKRANETEPHRIELVAGVTTAEVIQRYLINVALSATFFIVGFALFLFKPSKQTLLAALMFSLTSTVPAGSAGSIELTNLFDWPFWARVWWEMGFTIGGDWNLPILIHFALFFPERSLLLRRLPSLEWLIYLPVLFFMTPRALAEFLLYSGFTQFDFVLSTPLILLYMAVLSFHFIAAIGILLFNYLRADEANRRRIHLVVIGFTAALLPHVLNFTVITWLIFPNIAPSSVWVFRTLNGLIFFTPAFLMPITFSYAIVRHKVIPVSFIIRRGLQYLLAANALRALLVLLVLGVVWNVAANRSRSLDEILLHNSSGFYWCALFAVGLLLLNRYGLRDLVDRQFFREQYNQEHILRQLTEAVKNFDSLAALSRTVSDKLAAALHPSSIYLFFQQERETDFSVSYTTEEPAQNLKLPVTSPLLQFLQTATGAINFPSKQTDDLPNSEKRWLNEINADLLVPMHGSNGKLTGFFVLGEKKSEIPYTGRDRDLLETLAHQIALVEENLTLRNSLRREKTVRAQVLARFDAENINLLKECHCCGKCFDAAETNCPDDGAELQLTLPVERTIEHRYRLEKLIGKGGMGAVYEATDERLNRLVAVKILSGASFGDQDALRRFEREAQTIARLQHPNIVAVFDYGALSTEGAYLVMELVCGETLRQVLRGANRLDLAITVNYFSQVLDAVAVAHEAGIIHRDLKPENVLVSTDKTSAGRLRVLDFGLAKFSENEIFTENMVSVTKPGTILGTFGYMPPEQLRGEPVNATGDLFAVGVMIYEAINGEKPFGGSNYHELLAKMSDPLKISVDDPLRDFFAQALARERENRFATASAMKKAFYRSLNL